MIMIMINDYGWLKKMKKIKCKKCNHIWIQRIERLPMECPNCKNRNWNKGE